MEEDHNYMKKSNSWLTSLSEGKTYELEALSLKGLTVLEAKRGFVRCTFTISDQISDKYGNWQVGAMSTLIDDVGAAAIFSLVGHIKVSLDFSISFFSPAKTQEEVVIVAKVMGEKGRLASVEIEVRRKDDGQLIALGKQWMAASSGTRSKI